MTVTVVTRAQWDARPPRRTPTPIATPTPRLWLHHTASEWHGDLGVRQTQDFHIDTKGWNDIAYSWLVDDDGTIYEGRGAGVAGAHTEGDNDTSHAICAMGDFSRRPPTDRLLQAIADLAAHGHRSGWFPAAITGGHRDAPGAQTACPGSHLHARIPDLNAAIAAQLTHGGDDDMNDLERDQLAQTRMIVADVQAQLADVREILAGWVPGSARSKRTLIGRIGDRVKAARE